MYLVQDRTGAIVLMILSLWCLGSWPAFFNILERRGRLPQHTYLDYAISTFIVAVLFAVTFGEIGFSAQNFSTQLLQIQENGMTVMIAMLGGLALCFGNMVMQYCLAFVGISLTEVVSASIAVIAGTTVNYFLDNELNRAVILFPGVACFLVAVILGCLCHASNAMDISIKLGKALNEGMEEEILSGSEDAASSLTRLLEEFPDQEEGVEGGREYFHFSSSALDRQLENEHLSAGSAEFFHHIEENRSIKIRGSSAAFGLSIAFLTGFCYAFFSPLVNLATNDQLHLLRPGVIRLSVYTTFFYFSAAFLICAIAVNIYLLYNPILGLPKSSISSYIMDSNGRTLAILAGIVCGIGNGFQFMGGEAAGYAAADAVQAMPLVGTFWGVVLFGEYHKSSGRTYVLLAGMLAMFGIAVGLLIGSSRQRF